jgi:hypothetical protein
MGIGMVVLSVGCGSEGEQSSSLQQPALRDGPFPRSPMWNKKWDAIDVAGPQLGNDPAIAWLGDELHVFGPGLPEGGPTHSLVHKWWHEGAWSNEVLFLPRPIDSAPAAVAHDGVIELFFGEGSLLHLQWSSAARSLVPFGGELYEDLGAPTSASGTRGMWGNAPAAVMTKAYGRFHRLVDRLDVFVHGPDHHLWQLSWTGAPPFGAWVDLGGFMTSSPAAAPFSVSGDPLEVSDVAVVYRDDAKPQQLVQRVRLGTSSWLDEDPIPGIVPVGSPALVGGSERDLDLFVAAGDGLYRARSRHYNWFRFVKMANCVHGCAPLPFASVTQRLLSSAPAAANDGRGRTDVMIWGTDGGLWRDYRSISASALGAAVEPPCDCNEVGKTCCGGGNCGGALVCEPRTNTCQSCGAADERCCADGGCNAGLICDPGSSSCRSAPSCGYLGLACCADRNISCLEGVCGADDKCATPATFSKVYAILSARRCGNCHERGPDDFLGATASDTYDALLSPPRRSREQPALFLVNAGAPNDSYLYQKVLPAPTISGGKMGSLSADEKNQIYTWILDGAKND